MFADDSNSPPYPFKHEAEPTQKDGTDEIAPPTRGTGTIELPVTIKLDLPFKPWAALRMAEGTIYLENNEHTVRTLLLMVAPARMELPMVDVALARLVAVRGGDVIVTTDAASSGLNAAKLFNLGAMEAPWGGFHRPPGPKRRAIYAAALKSRLGIRPARSNIALAREAQATEDFQNLALAAELMKGSSLLTLAALDSRLRPLARSIVIDSLARTMESVETQTGQLPTWGGLAFRLGARIRRIGPEWNLAVRPE